MKTGTLHKILLILLPLLGLTSLSSFAQDGRVVINEYMPWPANSCGTTAEFVELLNFGPGPVNIGCYVLTDGDYSITIPPNTILQPGQFYVLAGQDVLPAPCGNVDSAIHAALNWNTCNCTSGTIPTTGDGLFTDGGSANEQVVLLDNHMKVVDAVVRALPAEPNSTITTASLSGGCSSTTFNLDSMTFTYETLGMSTGRGNSFARVMDGDCGWVKQPQVSANATNNKGNVTSNVSYTMTVVQSQDCDATHGAIDVYVNVSSSSYSSIFPMNYTIAYDVNNDGVYDFNDSYTYGVDSTPPSISITGLPMGNYNITVASVMGCYLHTFPVSILSCTGILPEGLAYFKLKEARNGTANFEWMIAGMENFPTIELERSGNGTDFMTVTRMDSLHYTGTKIFDQWESVDGNFPFYRLRMTDKLGAVRFSPVVKVQERGIQEVKLWPNPTNDQLNLQFTSKQDQQASYQIYNTSGALVTSGRATLHTGSNVIYFSTGQLLPGTYQLLVKPANGQLFSLRFVKP